MENTELVYSVVTPDNYHPVFDLQCLCHSHPWSERVFADSLTENYFAIQAHLNNQLVGFYLGLRVLDEATLMDIAVSPDAQGKGIGRDLLNHFLNNCLERNLVEVWLEVRASNAAAIHLYEDVGFTLIEQRKGYYPSDDGREDALIMKKSL